jgi:polysaccharide biosynthesis protein PslG
MWPQYNDSIRTAVLDKMQQAGITWVRIDASWARIEDTGKGARNATTLGLLTNCITMSKNHGMQVMIDVYGTPGWANSNAGSKAPPTNSADFGDFMGWIAGNYKGKVAAWQIYNELNNGGFWSGTATQYANLVKAVYQPIKAADSSSLVVLGGIMWQDAPYLQSLYNVSGFKDAFDVVATHGYQWESHREPEYLPPDPNNIAYLSHATLIHNVIVNNGDNAQFWFSEVGWSTHSDAGFDTASNPWASGVTEAMQADYSVRTINYVRSNFPWLGVLFFYKERSFADNGTWQSIQAEGYGLIRADGSVRPVYTALKQRITGS